MKNLTVLIFIVALFSCEESNPEKVEAFKDITGEWSFTGDVFSGSFKVVKALDGKFAIEPPNPYTINGKEYTATGTVTIPMNGLQINIQLVSEGDGFIILREVLYKSDYTEMTSGSQVYSENCLTNPSCPDITTETNIKIIRK